MKNKKTKLYLKNIKLIATTLTPRQLKHIYYMLEMAYLDGKMAQTKKIWRHKND